MPRWGRPSRFLRPAVPDVEAVAPDPSDLVTVRQAAAYLGVSVQRVRHLVKLGRFGWAWKKGRKEWLIDRNAVVRYGAGPRQPGRPPRAADWSFRLRSLLGGAAPERLRFA